MWRNTHPYVIVDRHEDITHPNKISEEPTCDRSVTFYGYVHGTHLKPGTKMHLIGVGDFAMSELNAMADPCPLPDKEKKSQVRENVTYIYLLQLFAEQYLRFFEIVIEQKRLAFICTAVKRWCCFF